MNALTWLGLAANGKPLEVGDAAPDAVARDEEGKEIRLSDFYGEGHTLIYFYPKADTPGCTAQACSLRDEFDQLHLRGVKILGVSVDRPDLQRRFKRKFRLPFTLVADTTHAVANAFHVPMIFGHTRRQAFLIKKGKIVWRDLGASTRDQAKDVLEVLGNTPE